MLIKTLETHYTSNRVIEFRFSPMKFDRNLGRLWVLAAFLTSAPAKGTLIMAFCNGDNLYLGSDSLEKTLDSSYTNHVEKIRLVGEECCFSITGIATYNVPAKVRGRILHFDCPSEMERAFRETQLQRYPLRIAITNTVRVFEGAYKAFCAEAIAGGTTNLDKAVFTFWGYDNHSDSFLGLSWATEGTNHGIFQITFDSRTNAGNLFLQGECDFLSGFIQNHNDFPTVELSANSKKTWDKIAFRQPVSEEEIVSEMVELFAVHKKYAVQFSSDHGFIGEPYVVWRLRKNGAKKVGAFYFSGDTGRASSAPDAGR
jgi:hypothetical protein